MPLNAAGEEVPLIIHGPPLLYTERFGGPQYKKCQHHGLTPHREESSGKNRPRRWRCIACKSVIDRTSYRGSRLKLCRALGGCRCHDCGKRKWSRNLHFHHVDPRTKSFAVGNNDRNQTFEEKLKEIKKCVLLCHKCHVAAHRRLRAHPLQDEITASENKRYGR